MAALQQERDDALAQLADATSAVQALRASAQAINGSRQVWCLPQSTLIWFKSGIHVPTKQEGEGQRYA